MLDAPYIRKVPHSCTFRYLMCSAKKTGPQEVLLRAGENLELC